MYKKFVLSIALGMTFSLVQASLYMKKTIQPITKTIQPITKENELRLIRKQLREQRNRVAAELIKNKDKNEIANALLSLGSQDLHV